MRKIVEDQADKDQVKLSVPALYESIRRSNSSLNRRPKRLLEDSLERVVDLVKLDLFGEDEEDSVEGDFEGLEEQPSQPQVWQTKSATLHSIAVDGVLTEFRKPIVSTRALWACGTPDRNPKHLRNPMELKMHQYLRRLRTRNDNTKANRNHPSVGKLKAQLIDLHLLM